MSTAAALHPPGAMATGVQATQAWSAASSDGRRVAVRTHVGLVRTRLEDAWRVAPGVPFLGGRVDAFAVFDGLGGRPNGDAAAWAASRALPAAVQAAGSPADILANLEEAVAPTGGMTTAVVALCPSAGMEGPSHLLSSGDSSAYTLQDGRVTLLVPRDRSGRATVTDCLGNGRAHAQVRTWGWQGPLLMCTDGIDDVVGAEALRATLEAPPNGLAAALDRLMEEVLAAGAPDNATVLALSRPEPRGRVHPPVPRPDGQGHVA